ncbi:helix-turn-helix domain-containing protein [Sphingomonas sp. Ant20]|jgi:hypothetical protein|uniref:helix-turn-helix domain-containing protein n=1 Tax=Sphingomonas sp. Ant20 TaxID=104605 RepID=UPI0009FF54CB|nr:helix-turn-helix domain-containing protein [Sphingomonas sp. Ant20]
MSVRIMTAVWSVTLPDSEKIVLLALADCANDEGLCWPSMATLAAKCSKSDRTVQAAIKSLVASGHMSRQEIAGRGCRYIVHPTPEAAAPPKPLHPEAISPPKRTALTPEAAADKPSRTITSPEASPPSRRGRVQAVKVKPFRLPEDWAPVRFADDTVARAIVDRRGKDWSLRALESFRNWAANAADKDGLGRKADWQKAWSNWIIEQDNRDGQRSGNGRVGGNGQSRSGHGRTVDAAERFKARRGLSGPGAGV